MSYKQSKLEKLSFDIWESIRDEKNYLLGRVLTIVDSAFTDPEQRKAVKDLVNDAFYSRTFDRDYYFKQFAEATKMAYPSKQLDEPCVADAANRYDGLEN